MTSTQHTLEIGERQRNEMKFEPAPASPRKIRTHSQNRIPEQGRSLCWSRCNQTVEYPERGILLQATNSIQTPHLEYIGGLDCGLLEFLQPQWPRQSALGSNPGISKEHKERNEETEGRIEEDVSREVHYTSSAQIFMRTCPLPSEVS